MSYLIIRPSRVLDTATTVADVVYECRSYWDPPLPAFLLPRMELSLLPNLDPIVEDAAEYLQPAPCTSPRAPAHAITLVRRTSSGSRPSRPSPLRKVSSSSSVSSAMHEDLNDDTSSIADLPIAAISGIPHFSCDELPLLPPPYHHQHVHVHATKRSMHDSSDGAPFITYLHHAQSIPPMARSQSANAPRKLCTLNVPRSTSTTCAKETTCSPHTKPMLRRAGCMDVLAPATLTATDDFSESDSSDDDCEIPMLKLGSVLVN